jgi:hypothetical protein
MKAKAWFIPSIYLALWWGRLQARCEPPCRWKVLCYRHWGIRCPVRERTAAKVAGIMRKRALG